MLRRLVVVGAAVTAFQLPAPACRPPARSVKTAAALIEDTQATSAAAPEAAEDSLDSAAGVPPETDTFAPPSATSLGHYGSATASGCARPWTTS